MSETAFRLFNQGFALTAELLYAAALTLFLRPLLRGRGGWAAVLLTDLTVWLLCEGLSLPPGSLSVLLGAALLLGARPLGVDRPLMLLLMLLFLNTRISSGLIAESIYYVAERLLPTPTEPIETVFLQAAVLVSSFLLTHALLLCGMVLLLRRRLGRPALHWRELCCLGLLPAAGILFGQMMARLLFEVKDGMPLQLYDRHPAFAAVVPLLALLFYLGAYLSIVLWQGLERLRGERETYFVECQQALVLRERMEEAERFFRQTSALKHELRGHAMNLRGLAQSGQWEELEQYLRRLDESVQELTLTTQTGSSVADVVLSDKARQCAALGIDLQLDFRWPEAKGYDAFDVGIILQNLLQNAIEATVPLEGRRWISLTGQQRGNFFLIEVKNPFQGTLTWGIEGLPVTSKTEEGASLHGIGLANARREAEKYMGELELHTDGQTFCAAVLLQERSDAT